MGVKAAPFNTHKNSACEICGRDRRRLLLSGFDDLTDSGSLESNTNNNNSVGSVFFPLRRCSKRKEL
ncbi:hypothetical protein Bca52824_079226 [Brassica carinata]|uniref:Uncharacterized protein n=1 Tax=Brassica carinata TaxID=52824 RepID=A0A8X7PZU3_BRACI|nr:hypothetical protein Bca52824_079226 [Brassica carinata]